MGSGDVAALKSQVNRMHCQLRPEQAIYCTRAGSVKEADEWVKWFVRKT